MAKSKIEYEDYTDDGGFSDSLDVTKEVVDVHTPELENTIKQDYTLSYLGDKDKIGTIDMTGNAYFMLDHYKKLAEKILKEEWNPREKRWTRRHLTPEEKKPYLKLGASTFDLIMNRVHMVQVVNRNVKGNPLVEGVLRSPLNNPQEGAGPEEETGAKALVQKVKNKLQGMTKEAEE